MKKTNNNNFKTILKKKKNQKKIKFKKFKSAIRSKKTKGG